MFFKRDINTLLNDLKRNVTVIYSGGDDMFLIGAWDDIVYSAIDINAAFRRYTQGKLTLSAGIGLYPDKYPIHVMARETGDLEDYAKGAREDGTSKNAVVLFAESLRFGWDEFKDDVIDKKLSMLTGFFDDNTEKGNSFLYKILSLIEGIEKEEKDKAAKISLARYAYLLARAEPDGADAEKMREYDRFSKRMYDWISVPAERKRLKAAIYLYVYSKRVKKIKED
jgi:CRISPR-associated protein Csm1